jgi:hypothetical protein
LKHRAPPLWPNYIGARRRTCAKTYGIKVRCYGEHVEEYIENLMETSREHNENTLRTREK